jgi:hypothetical protein
MKSDMGAKNRMKSADCAPALRAAGFVRVPGYWVRPEDLELIRYMAEKHSHEVNAIRVAVTDRPE